MFSHRCHGENGEGPGPSEATFFTFFREPVRAPNGPRPGGEGEGGGGGLGSPGSDLGDLGSSTRGNELLSWAPPITIPDRDLPPMSVAAAMPAPRARLELGLVAGVRERSGDRGGSPRSLRSVIVVTRPISASRRTAETSSPRSGDRMA
jgi:hypothetical protein